MSRIRILANPGRLWLALALLALSASAAAQVQQAALAPPRPQPETTSTTGEVLPLYRALRNVGLDPQAVYKIREAEIDREDVHIWLNDGTIAFTQAVDGHITGAYFEGEGEVLIRPPDRMERASLGLFTDAGVLEEAFSSAYLRFNDDTAKDLKPFLRPPEEAADFVTHNDGTARTLAQIDAMRLCISFTSAPAASAPGEPPPIPDQLLHARIAGEHYGVFDVIFDTRSPEQVVVGNASTHEDQTYYDLWMSFPMKSLRKATLSDTRFGGPGGPLWTPHMLSISKYTINATLDPSRNLSVDATLDIDVKQGGTRIMMFELSRYLQVKQVEFEGKPMEIIQNEAVEGSELSRRGNDTIAVVFPSPLLAGAHFPLRFTYAGSVLADAGGGLLYVGARGTWYPNRGMAMADYDLTFHFPENLTLIATGKKVSLERDGAGFVGHWVSEQPIPIAGFNVGEYVENSAKVGKIEVDAYAARGSISRRSSPDSGVSPPLLSPHAPGTVEPVPMPPPLQNPASVGQSLADRAADTLTELAQMLGPYPYSTLSLTENPSVESQGWPSLIFLSSYAYLLPEQLRAMSLPEADAVIYSEVMMPHELSHQWYGDQVSWASYHEQWLLEALANYCSLLLLERSHPADVELTLENYRQILASRSREGRRRGRGQRGRVPLARRRRAGDRAGGRRRGRGRGRRRRRGRGRGRRRGRGPRSRRRRVDAGRRRRDHPLRRRGAGGGASGPRDGGTVRRAGAAVPGPGDDAPGGPPGRGWQHGKRTDADAPARARGVRRRGAACRHAASIGSQGGNVGPARSRERRLGGAARGVFPTLTAVDMLDAVPLASLKGA